MILRVYKDAHLVEVKQFDQSQIVIGRPGSEVDLFLDDESISSIHCLIELRGIEYRLCDLGSKSGVYLNKKLILDEVLTTGSEIQVGVYRIEFFVGVPKPIHKPVEVKPVEPISVEPKIESPSVNSQSIKGEANFVDSKTKEPAKKAVKSAATIQWLRKKATIAPKSNVESIEKSLKPGSGQNCQVIVSWKEHILQTYEFDSNLKVALLGSAPTSHIHVPSIAIDTQVALLKRTGDDIDVLVPLRSRANLTTSKQAYDHDQLVSVGRFIPAQGGHVVRLLNQELLNIKFETVPLEITVRRNMVGNKPKPVGFIDISSTEVTGLAVALVLVFLTAIYMSLYTPPPVEELVTEEVRLAQFVYAKPQPPPVVEPPPPPPPPPPVETPPPPPPPPVKVKVTEKSKQAETQSAQQKKGGSTAAAVRPNPSKIMKPNKLTSVKQGGAVKLGTNEGANAKSKEVDVSKSGLLSALGAGGNRSKLDMAYQGSGELLGTANNANGFSGQSTDRAGEDLGSRLKNTGAGGQGTATEGISGVNTKGRGSGLSGYGSLGEGSGKGQSRVDVPGGEVEFVGSIDGEAVRRAIRSIISSIRACYESRLNLDRNLAGKVVIRFVIGEEGKVISSVVKSSSVADPEVGRCVAARIQGQRFPEPPPGVVGEVSYPFVFDSQK